MAVVPMLGLLPLGQAPAGSLPSEAEVLRLVWGHVPDFKNHKENNHAWVKKTSHKYHLLDLSDGARIRRTNAPGHKPLGNGLALLNL